MINNILCFLNIHKYGDWVHVGMLSNHQEKLKRRCKNCGELDIYKGFTETCITTGKKSPYVFKH
jgi:hypothetical protein